MITCCVGEEAAEGLLQRRWFAANNAAVTLRGECEVLRAVAQLAEGAWHRAQAQLARLEAMRDALGEELAKRDREPFEATVTRIEPAVSTAA